MIICKLQGGLGNQMFQYAIARTLIKENEHVLFDFNFLKLNNKSTSDFTARKFDLNIFKQVSYKDASETAKMFYSNALINKIKRRIKGFTWILQKENELVKLPVKFKHAYLDGFFQSEQYFKQIREDLLKDFSFPGLDDTNELIRNQISQEPNSVSIHIRRGDYAKSATVTNYHGILPLSYYHNAIKHLQLNIGPISKVYVFTDDFNWVKANLRLSNVELKFVTGNETEAWKDMALMAACKHHIIANSSFSWWGAWLSTRKGHQYAPANWFNPKVVDFKIQNIVPAHWHIIE